MTELQHLNDIEILVIRSCYDSQMFTAIVKFKTGLPGSLKHLKENPLYTHQFRMGMAISYLTRAPMVSEITADVVAITSLGGHAYRP